MEMMMSFIADMMGTGTQLVSGLKDMFVCTGVCSPACIGAWLSTSVYLSVYINLPFDYLHIGAVCVCVQRLEGRSTHFVVFGADFYETCFLTHVCVFSLFLTPMFVLQDSVPMASPAFLLSLFVSIQVLPQISPEPGHATHTLASKQRNTHTHTL